MSRKRLISLLLVLAFLLLSLHPSSSATSKATNKAAKAGQTGKYDAKTGYRLLSQACLKNGFSTAISMFNATGADRVLTTHDAIDVISYP